MPHDPLHDFDTEIMDFLRANGVEAESLQLVTPPDRTFGDRSTSVAFQLAKVRRQRPLDIATTLASSFDPSSSSFISRVEAAGNGHLNFYLNYSAFIPAVITTVEDDGHLFGRRDGLDAKQIVVEHTSVNPNKEWHIGHVRNAVLGDVVVRALRLCGHHVEAQNYIDDTGLQAAQAIHALQAFPENQVDGEKYDHYLGRLYVKVASEFASEASLRQTAETLNREASDLNPPGITVSTRSIDARLQNIEVLKQGVMRTMHALEAGEHHAAVAAILRAQLLTAFRLGVFYDLLSWESHLVQSHIFEQAMGKLQQASHVYYAEEGRYRGALIIQVQDTAPEGEEPKAEVLIRSNGIPTYVGKDIAYHLWKFGLVPDPLHYERFLQQPNGEEFWSTALSGENRDTPPPTSVINVIGVHQAQAQDTVRAGLRAAGFDEAADNLVHLSYGMVGTAEGKISGRKGTFVSGDSVIDETVNAAYDAVRGKRSEDLDETEMRATAEAIGVGAVRYFMIQYNPAREITFDVKDVVNFDGNTALYIQYAVVRMGAILRRAESDLNIHGADLKSADVRLLTHEQEKRLCYHLAQYPGTVATVARTLSVNLIAEYAHDLAVIFSAFYRDCSVLNAEDDLRRARLRLVQVTREALVNVCGVLGIPVIERL